eukprot:Rhum_TRINITY_DN11666_c0_g1::Rhum_TRINITY_DN11666_c0_g1_i1::g.46048::m.46048
MGNGTPLRILRHLLRFLLQAHPFRVPRVALKLRLFDHLLLSLHLLPRRLLQLCLLLPSLLVQPVRHRRRRAAPHTRAGTLAPRARARAERALLHLLLRQHLLHPRHLPVTLLVRRRQVLHRALHPHRADAHLLQVRPRRHRILVRRTPLRQHTLTLLTELPPPHNGVRVQAQVCGRVRAAAAAAIATPAAAAAAAASDASVAAARLVTRIEDLQTRAGLVDADAAGTRALEVLYAEGAFGDAGVLAQNGARRGARCGRRTEVVLDEGGAVVVVGVLSVDVSERDVDGGQRARRLRHGLAWKLDLTHGDARGGGGGGGGGCGGGAGGAR